MQQNNFQLPFMDNNDADSIDSKLKKMLSAVRKHLGMEVAFISEFSEGERVFRFVDADNTHVTIAVGDSDPLEDTYCKRIVDNELDNIIHDTSKNNITKNLDVTDKLSIGSYLGVSIRLSNGKVYGTFCCYKNDPDTTLNARDLSFLNIIAEIVSSFIEKDLEEKFKHREVTERIRSVLDNNSIDIHYQPIYNLHSNKISGFESLSRFSSEPYRTPDIWFGEALQVGLGEDLEIMAIEKAVKAINLFDSSVYISLNISPEYILNGSLARALDDIDVKRIVLEVTEHSPIKDYSIFRKTLNPLRQRGIRLAIDDAGAGYASFQHILELEADIIKLDISLTKNINREPRKYLLAKALCAFSKAIKCTIIAEGIENTEELNALRELGVDKIQGYLLGRPMPTNEAISFVCNNGLND